MKIVGHRGASGDAPENTMAAFWAAKDVGADGIEFDVQRSADGELVVIHDYSVDRTTDGTGLVSELTTEEIARFDAGSWFSSAFSGAKVPRLSEVLGLDSLEFEVEIKCFDRDGMLAVLDAVRLAGALARAEFTSWNTPMLMALKDECPSARIGMFSRRRETWMADPVFEQTIVGGAAFTTADIVHVYAGDITPSIVDALHAQGREVHANDAATVGDLERALKAGADRTSTNHPEMAVRWLRTGSAS